MSRACNKHSHFPMTVTLLTLVFLYMPLIVMVIASFNSSRYSGIWTKFSMIWYKRLLHDGSVWEAFRNTIIIASVSTVIATVLGTLSALALYRSRNKFRGVYFALIYTPLVVPDIL